MQHAESEVAGNREITHNILARSRLRLVINFFVDLEVHPVKLLADIFIFLLLDCSLFPYQVLFQVRQCLSHGNDNDASTLGNLSLSVILKFTL